METNKLINGLFRLRKLALAAVMVMGMFIFSSAVLAAPGAGPKVNDVTTTAPNGSYTVGTLVPIPIQVVFDKNVNVTGTPQLTLATGSPASTVLNYVSGSGGKTLIFNYTVASGNASADLDYVNTTSLSLNGGTINENGGGGGVATLTLPAPGAAHSLGANKNIVIDTTAPTVLNVSSTATDGTHILGDKIPVTVQFSEVVQVTGTPQLRLATGTPASTAVNYKSGDNTDTLTFEYTVVNGNSAADLDYTATGALTLNGGTIKDGINNAILTLAAPGAAGSLGANKAIVIDSTIHSGATFSDSNAVGSKKWNQPGNAEISDGVYSTTDDMDSGEISHYLKATKFGFAVPNGATIDGITVEVERYGTDANFFDNAIRIVKGGVVGATDKSSLVAWASADPNTYVSYGGAADTWGETWTSTDINNANFGVAISAIKTGGANNKRANIDHIRIKVYYTPDITVPTVTGVTSSLADGTYTTGQVVPVEVTFSEKVLVTGTPQIYLATGSPVLSIVDYTGGSGTDTLTFNYTVGVGNFSTDLDYTNINALVLNGGTIKDAAENSAVRTLPVPGAAGSLAANKAIVIVRSPAVTNVSSTSPNGTYKIGDIIPVTVTFDAPVDVTGVPQLTLETGGVDEVVDYTSGTGTATLSFDYTVVAGDTTENLDYLNSGSLVLNGGTIKNSSGLDAILTLPDPTTAGSLSANKTIIIDGIVPVVSNVTSPSENGYYGTGAVIPITVEFVKKVKVNVTGSPTLTLETGIVDRDAVYFSGSGTSILTFHYTVQAGDMNGDLDYLAMDSLNLNGGTIQDYAGNEAVLTLAAPGANKSLGKNKNLNVDTTLFTVSLSTTPIAGATNVSPIPMTATFSDDAKDGDFTESDITVHNGTVAAGSLAGGPAVFTFSVTPAGEGEVKVDIGKDKIEDTIGNKNKEAPTFKITYDITKPRITKAVMLDTDSDGKVDRITLTFDKNIENTEPGGNGFDVTGHGSCNSEYADPDGTKTLYVDFLCDTIGTDVGDLNLILTSNVGVRDLAGNLADSVTLTKTEVAGPPKIPAIDDLAKPLIVKTVPADGAAGIPVGTPIKVIFSEPMDPGSPPFTISDDRGTAYITPPAWDGTFTTATISHGADWATNTDVKVTVNDKDVGLPHANKLGGTLLSYKNPWTFTTHAPGNLGQTNLGAAVDVDNTNGYVLSGDASTAIGNDIVVNGFLQDLSSITSGDLVGQDMTAPVTIGDVSVLPVQAITINTAGPGVTHDLTNTSLPGVDVAIPDNTTTYGCAAWDGRLKMNAGTNTGTAPSGFLVGSYVVDVGSPICPLLLDRPTTITITGMTGSVAYKPAGSANWFTVPTCGGTYVAPVAPPVPSPYSECSISDGVDTKILTYHFTSFGSLSAAPAPPAPPAPAVGATGQGSGWESSDTETSTVQHFAAAEDNKCDRNQSTIVPFTDIADHFAKSFIEKLYWACSIDGRMETEFKPNDFMFRGEMAKLLAVAFNLGTSTYEPYFTDVLEDDAFAPYIIKLVQKGLMHGERIGFAALFEPLKSLTRGDAIGYIFNLKHIDLGNYKTTFVDVKPDDWFYDEVAFAQNKGILMGHATKYIKKGLVSKFYNLPANMTEKSTGKDVIKLKEILSQLDYYSGEINGIYDKQLVEAVKVYQTARKLKVTGLIDSATKVSLHKENLAPKDIYYFRPYGNITRGEVAKLLYLIKAYQPEVSVVKTNKPVNTGATTTNKAPDSKVLGVSAVRSTSFASFLWTILETAIDNLGKSFGL
jgi:hypothetical protein